MALAVEAPAREDLSFYTNDDKRVGALWWHRSATESPVVIDSAMLTLRFDPILGLDGVLPPEVHVIDSANSTTPGDPVGWFDAAGFADGIVLATVPHTIWAGYVMRAGDWDLVAVGEGIQRCLVRGVFIATEGIST